MEFFDTHSHYNDEKFDEDREEIIRATFDSNITKFIPLQVMYNLKWNMLCIKTKSLNIFLKHLKKFDKKLLTNREFCSIL